ncbi:MAG: hypothetical protein RI897_2240 [Verrucomicrobiota bacterium]
MDIFLKSSGPTIAALTIRGAPTKPEKPPQGLYDFCSILNQKMTPSQRPEVKDRESGVRSQEPTANRQSVSPHSLPSPLSRQLTPRPLRRRLPLPLKSWPPSGGRVSVTAMKTDRLWPSLIPLWIAACLLLPLASTQNVLAQAEARITRIVTEQHEILVTVSVPEGLRKITLESRQFHDAGAWQPRAVARINGNPAEITFRIPISKHLELLRVRADATEPLPEIFYEGLSQFNPEPGAGYDLRYLDGPVAATPGEDANSTEDRQVEESDIWKLKNNTLYVFNQYRGLQVIDVSDPDSPILTGTLNLPTQGEEMYLLQNSYTVLLSTDPCYWGPEGNQSSVIIANVTQPNPTLAATLPVTGSIRESRLVGSILYLATESFQSLPDNSWQWGITVYSINLDNPASPTIAHEQRFTGNGLVIQATPSFLFVAAQNPQNYPTSTLRVFDISNPSGQIAEIGSVTTFGSINDKFKIHWYNDTLRIVSAAWETTSNTWLNRLETFHLPSPSQPQTNTLKKLGQLDLGRGERLFATRFDQNLAYIVTYFVVDPLWVVDISNPNQPTITGELHVPGWSTYIHPLGSHLLAMGIDDTDGRRAAVSLFDVSNPANPTLTQRVSLGDGYSWSEANATEKAFTVLPDDNLILVPYTGENNGTYASRVQLIDFNLNPGQLELRGEILHRFGARRTTIHQNRILSVSNLELLSVDISNRDLPSITSTLTLAWSTDDVFPHNDQLIQITRGNEWLGPSSIQVSTTTDPDTPLASIQLPTDWPILGTDVHDNLLAILQGIQGTPDIQAPDSPHNLRLSLYSLNQPDNPITLVSTLETTVAPLGWGGNFQFLFLQPNLLVLAGGGNYGYYYPFWDTPLGAPEIMPRYYWGGSTPGGNRFIAINLATPESPQLLSDLTVEIPNAYAFTPAFPQQNLVYLSHARTLPPEDITVIDPTTGEPRKDTAPDWFTATRHELDVIDYSDPTHPELRQPIPLPGRLESVGHQGSVLYTQGTHWEPTADWSYNGSEYIDALAYDGVEVFQIASLPLPTTWPRPVKIQNDTIYLGQTAESGSGSLDVLQLTPEKQFATLNSLPLKQIPYSFESVDNLLIGNAYSSIQVIHLPTPTTPTHLGTFEPSLCYGIDASKAQGSLTDGLWFPLGLHGTWHIPLTP